MAVLVVLHRYPEGFKNNEYFKPSLNSRNLALNSVLQEYLQNIYCQR